MRLRRGAAPSRRPRILVITPDANVVVSATLSENALGCPKDAYPTRDRGDATDSEDSSPHAEGHGLVARAQVCVPAVSLGWRIGFEPLERQGELLPQGAHV